MSENKLEKLNNNIFKIDELKEHLLQNRSILILSRSGSGKSVLIKNLIKYYISNFIFNSIVLYSKTAKYENEYDFIDNKNKFDGSISELINNILEYQKTHVGNKILLILDDVITTKRDDYLSDLFTKSRHFGITLILSSQYSKLLVSGIIRSNFNILFFNQLNYDGLDTIYRIIYLDIDKKTFFKFIYDIKNKYAFIMYDNTGKKIEEAYKLCQAQLLDFKIKF